MAQILSLTMALLLTASVAAADVPTPPAKRTVRFAPVSSTERLRALIQAEINQFTDRRWRFVTFVHDANADFDYSDLHTESHGSSRLQLVANVKERSGTSHRVNSAWLDWDGSARSLFYELMEKTLFNEEQGVYRPLRIESCSIAGMLVRVSEVRDPSNAPFDSPVGYRLAVSDDGKHFTPICFDLEVVDIDASPGTTAATFEISLGGTVPQKNFRDSCRQQNFSGFLIPRPGPCLESGATNSNVNSLSAPH